MRLKFCRGTEGGTRRLCKWVYRGIEVEKRTGMGLGQIQEQIGIIVIPSIEGMQHTSMSYRYGINQGGRARTDFSLAWLEAA